VGRTSGRDLLLPDHPPEILFGQLEEAFQLPDAVLANIAGSQRSTGLLHEPDSLFMVGLGDVEGVFKGGVVESFVIHGTSVVPIPGRFQQISRESAGNVVTGPSGPPF
jgi:hypothetical protein